MPIEKLASGKIVCLFGTGDILIAAAKDEGFESDPPFIILANQDPLPIGVIQNYPDKKREPNWVIKMYFNKPESLDALIHVLQDFKIYRFPVAGEKCPKCKEEK